MEEEEWMITKQKRNKNHNIFFLLAGAQKWREGGGRNKKCWGRIRGFEEEIRGVEGWLFFLVRERGGGKGGDKCKREEKNERRDGRMSMGMQGDLATMSWCLLQTNEWVNDTVFWSTRRAGKGGGGRGGRDHVAFLSWRPTLKRGKGGGTSLASQLAKRYPMLYQSPPSGLDAMYFIFSFI